MTFSIRDLLLVTVIVVHAAGHPVRIALSDGSPLVRVAKGRYETPLGMIVVSEDAEAP